MDENGLMVKRNNVIESEMDEIGLNVKRNHGIDKASKQDMNMVTEINDNVLKL